MKPWTEHEMIIYIWNPNPNLHTNSHFTMWAEKWTTMDYIAMIGSLELSKEIFLLLPSV